MKTLATALLLVLPVLLATTALATDCTRGNPNAPLSWAPDQAGGDLRFAMLLTPEGINCCDADFLPENGTFYFHADPMEWVTVGVTFAIHEAVWNNGAQALVPGAERCRTADGWVVIVDIAGEYQVTIPPSPELPGFEGCDGLASDQPWFVVFHAEFENSDVRLDVGTAGPAIHDAYYLSQDDGPWLDLSEDLGWNSGPVLNAGVTCTSQPVATQARSWSEVKAIHR